ncbi:glycosyltransferase [Caballeronia sp. EK]|uniref:glycosyltransferase n=1 Tax=Caballeronia sp. EK TaxID=2767469 RepID=UPI001655EC79|nr:glycosyltransferase [Caballeronia sp. EK]MBC8638552.1 glycosyltransferase [Caballeronia sp. EK]
MADTLFKRGVRRVIRQVASSLRTPAAPSVREEALGRARATLSGVQGRFDDAHPITADTLVRAAKESSMIVAGFTPFPNVAMLVDALRLERIHLGELVIVDATAEEPRLVAIRDHRLAWGRRLPLTRIVVVPYARQEFRFADAMNEGMRYASGKYIWIAGRDLVPVQGCFEYLLKAMLARGEKAVVISELFGPDGQRMETNLPSAATSGRPLPGATQSLDVRLYPSSVSPHNDLAADFAESAPPVSNFIRGLFGGPRSLIADKSNGVFDPRFITNIAVADYSLRLAEGQVNIYRAPAAAWSQRGEPTDAGAPWEALHDWRWLIDRRAEHAKSERIELVCPFHRGDVVLATQVAAHAVGLGKLVRLHVARGLMSWVRDFAPDLPLEAVDVPIASAEDTYPLLLQAYHAVSQRPDASPLIARCHPSRSLSETGLNLVEYMLEEVGLPLDTLLGNIEPLSTDEQRRVADELMREFGSNVMFVHPFGGWSLKSIPPHILQEFAQHVHEHGFKLVQIGGAQDRRLECCDGAILQNFLPSQWREILARGSALSGVDSWTAHFGAILDIPQISFFGSTHPKHVSTKRFFAKQTRPNLVLGPVVNCSPCNSLTCISFPDRDYCTGYAIDADALHQFLSALGCSGAQMWERRIPNEMVFRK